MILLIVTVIGVVGWLVFSNSKPSSPLSMDKLKIYLADEVNVKSQASETQLREKLNGISFTDLGLNKEGESYADYCEQQNESGTLNSYYVKQCTQHLVLYFSGSNDVKSINAELSKVFQQDNRFISTYPESGVCLGGQTTLLRNAAVTYSKSKDLAINNQLSGFYAIQPVDKAKRDKSCESRIQDILPGEDRYFNKSITINEDDLGSKMLNKNAKSMAVLVFYRTYFKEAI